MWWLLRLLTFLFALPRTRSGSKYTFAMQRKTLGSKWDDFAIKPRHCSPIPSCPHLLRWSIDQVTITHRSLRKPRAQRITSPNPCVRCGDRLLVLLANLPRGSVLSHAAGIHFADSQDHCSFVQVTVGVFHPWIPRGSRNWTSASQKTMVYKVSSRLQHNWFNKFSPEFQKTNSNSVRSIQFQNNAIHHSSINLFGVTENSWAFTTLRRPWLGLHILDSDHLHYIR